MEKKAWVSVPAALGAIIGAGFASGREIMRFFSVMGPWSWACVAAASAAMTFLAFRLLECGRYAGGALPPVRDARLRAAGEIAFGALMAVTAGSMLGAAGELAALSVPLHGAYWLGLLGTLAASVLLLRFGIRPLAAVGQALLPLMVVMFLLCLKAETPAPLPAPDAGAAAGGLLRALAYAGMNITLAAGVLCEAGRACTGRSACRTAAWLGVCLTLLLSLGNAAFLPRVGELKNAPLPTVLSLREYGLAGFWVSVAGLYLAVLSTLMAVQQTLFRILARRMRRKAAAAAAGALGLAFSLVGFNTLVSAAYPALGYACLALLLCALPKRAPRKAEASEKG